MGEHIEFPCLARGALCPTYLLVFVCYFCLAAVIVTEPDSDGTTFQHGFGDAFSVIQLSGLDQLPSSGVQR